VRNSILRLGKLEKTVRKMKLMQEGNNNKPKSQWLQTFWSKIVFELVVAGLFAVFHFIARKILPKRWRPQSGTVKEMSENVSEVANNLPHEDDDFVDLINKAQNFFNMIYVKFNQAATVQQDFAEYVHDISPDLVTVHDHYFAQQILPHVEEFAEKSVFHQYNQLTDLVCLKFKTSTGFFYLYMIGNVDGHGGHNYDSFFAHEKDCNYKSLLNLLFDKHDNRLYISVDEEDNELVCSTLDHQTNQDDYILDQHMFADLKEEINRFKERGKQRSYLLNGPPGTGKTTFCLELSSKMSGRILKIDSSIFIRLTSMSVRSVIENLDADFIIVDDIDRINSSDLPAFFYCLEAIKNYKRKPTLLATCNNIREMDLAIIRPGRFDDIKEFATPTKSQRKEFFEKLFKNFEMFIPENEIEQLVKATRGMTQAYLKEYAMQLKTDSDFQDVMKKIKCRQKYLVGMTSFEELEKYERRVAKQGSSKPVVLSVGHSKLVPTSELLTVKCKKT